jgi:hypothetical protein
MGQIAFSPKLQLACTTIYAWSLLLKNAKGDKVSSCLISRTLLKANLPSTVHAMDLATCSAKLKEAKRAYYSIRSSAPELRAKHLDNLAEVLAKEGNKPKETILRQLQQRENLRNSHRKIKYLRGKLTRNSTTIVTVLDENGQYIGYRKSNY